MSYIHLTQISTELCTLAKLNDSAVTRPGFPLHFFTRLGYSCSETFSSSLHQLSK